MTHPSDTTKDEAAKAFTGPDRSKQVIFGLAGFGILLMVIDVFVHKHGPFDIVHVIGFYILLGLLASLAIVGLAILARAILSRPEDYYDR